MIEDAYLVRNEEYKAKSESEMHTFSSAKVKMLGNICGCLMMICFVGCGMEPGPENDRSIIGTWRSNVIESELGTHIFTVSFNVNGTFSVEMSNIDDVSDGMRAEGNWKSKKNSDILILEYQKGGSLDGKYVEKDERRELARAIVKDNALEFKQSGETYHLMRIHQ